MNGLTESCWYMWLAPATPSNQVRVALSPGVGWNIMAFSDFCKSHLVFLLNGSTNLLKKDFRISNSIFLSPRNIWRLLHGYTFSLLSKYVIFFFLFKHGMIFLTCKKGCMCRRMPLYSCAKVPRKPNWELSVILVSHLVNTLVHSY